jgi:hypothetical protein
MREALFRVAQTGAFYLLEDTVGGDQDEALTEAVFRDSYRPLTRNSVGARSPWPADAVSGLGGPPRPALIVWPYPHGTADLIDRANCADAWLSRHLGFDLLTGHRLAHDPAAAESLSRHDTVLFADFESVLSGIDFNEPDWLNGVLRWHGRPITALLNELSLGHIVRRHHREPTMVDRFAALPAADRTWVLNGTTIAISKGAQLRHVADHARDLAALGIRVTNYTVADNRDRAIAASCRILDDYGAVVVRPFSASQGTGVSFLRDPGISGRRDACGALLDEVEAAVCTKYGVAGGYPVTITPWLSTRRIRGRVTDLRMFVVLDPLSGGVRAIPGVVRCAKEPLRPTDTLRPANAGSNLGKPSGDAGGRMFAATFPGTLSELDITAATLVALGKAATLLWSAAIGEGMPFCYGSVDFGLLEGSQQAVVFEMNGANVGMHPSVHPRYLPCFANATSAALDQLSRESTSRLPAADLVGEAALSHD